MLPYFEQPSYTVGPFTIYGYGILTFAAILTGWRLAVRRAGQVGLDAKTASRLCRLMALAGFAGAWMARTQIYAPGTRFGFSSFGGLALGLAAAWVYLRRSGETLRYLDAVAFAFPIAWMIGRAGCFLAHDHPGIRSESWLAVRFPGGPRFDLGLIEALYMLPVAGLFVLLGRRTRPPGFFAGMFLALYGPFRMALDRLHESPSADRWFGAAAAVVGVAILLRAYCFSSGSKPKFSSLPVR